MRLQVTLRESDSKLRDHFKPIAKGDQAHEARRLMLLGLEADEKLRGNFRNVKKNNETG
jgi:hypothetical protein